eukprot:TRINITY_DN8343_c0_g1_i1.p1 TRINITY_DN8343_c0_g1~~TRINITY_DN8343_c0_g1_i1.p1  ORF type:complete len:83 (-),score=9.03 TRINITY_DN8343_c0_g1_i1:142-390(-)
MQAMPRYFKCDCGPYIPTKEYPVAFNGTCDNFEKDCERHKPGAWWAYAGFKDEKSRLYKFRWGNEFVMRTLWQKPVLIHITV